MYNLRLLIYINPQINSTYNSSDHGGEKVGCDHAEDMLS